MQRIVYAPILIYRYRELLYYVLSADVGQRTVLYNQSNLSDGEIIRDDIH